MIHCSTAPLVSVADWLSVMRVINYLVCGIRAKLGHGLLSGKYSQPPPANDSNIVVSL